VVHEIERRLATSVLDVIEHDMKAPDALHDARPSAVLQAAMTMRAEIVAALASLEQPSPNGAK